MNHYFVYHGEYTDNVTLLQPRRQDMPTVQAIYSHGVFTPLSKVDLNESERVAIRIVPLDDWQERFNRLLLKVRRQSSAFATEEIESDIVNAVLEVKTAKHD